VLFLVVTTAVCFAIPDDVFPLPLGAGDSVTVTGEGTLAVPGDATWWILDDSQYTRALEIAEEYRLLLEQIELFREEVDVLMHAQEMRVEQLAVLQDGYEYYRGRYRDALDEMENLELELARERGLRRGITLVASGVALFAGGIFLGMSLGQ
jgi:hypothetical protein